MDFHVWFKSQFGKEISRESLQDLQNEIEQVEDKLDKLHEKRFELMEIQCLERGAFYAWNAQRFQESQSEAKATISDLIQNQKDNPFEKDFIQYRQELMEGNPNGSIE